MIPRRISQPFYNSAKWRKCRKGYIDSVGGLCERCLLNGKFKKGYIVHHKEYLTEETIHDPDKALAWGNLEYLCFDCHNQEHFEKFGVVEKGLMFDDDGNLIEQ